MFILKIYFLSAVLAAVRGGKLYFTSSPRNQAFERQENVLKKEDIHNVLQFLNGLPADKTSSWKGMKQMDIFHPPKSNLFIEVFVPKDLHFTLRKFITQYQTQTGDMHTSPSAYIDQAIKEVHSNSLLVNFNLDGKDVNLVTDGDINIPHSLNLNEMKSKLSQSDSVYFMLSSLVQHLNASKEADLKFFGELQIMQDIYTAIFPQDLSQYDMSSFSFQLSSLLSLTETYGLHSPQVQEAVAVLQYYITTYTRVMKRLFDDRFLAEVLVEEMEEHDDDHSRKTRSLLQTTTTTATTIATYVEPNSPDFPVVFNLCLWIVIGFALTVTAASYSLWFMDPGQDNIIYRITSQRMKIE